MHFAKMISITWNLIRNANSQDPPPPPKDPSRNSWFRLTIGLKSPAGDSETSPSWRTTALGHIFVQYSISPAKTFSCKNKKLKKTVFFLDIYLKDFKQ